MVNKKGSMLVKLDVLLLNRTHGPEVGVREMNDLLLPKPSRLRTGGYLYVSAKQFNDDSELVTGQGIRDYADSE